MARAEGYDVSHWQSMTPNLSNVDFLIAKASQGTSKDSMYETHKANARRAGKLFGAYCFNQPDMDIEAQVDTFIASAGDADFYALDVEKERSTGTRFTKVKATAFFKFFHQKKPGKKIVLYMSESIFWKTSAGQDGDWVAHWGGEPARHWDIWQYQGSPLDSNYYNGTIAEMRVFFTGEEPTPMTFQQVNIPTGTWLYVNKDMSANTDNIKIDPGRPMLLVAAKTGNGTHTVMYDNSPHGFYFVRQSDVTLTPLITEADCPDCPECPPSPECPPATADDCKAFSDAAYQQGHDVGYDEGKADGYQDGHEDGYTAGHEDGYAAGEADGLDAGVNNGIEQEQERIRNVLGL